MQKPSLGRTLLYQGPRQQNQWPCTITQVKSDTVVNVGGFEDGGRTFAAHDVPLVELSDVANDKLQPPYAYWPPVVDHSDAHKGHKR